MGFTTYRRMWTGMVWGLPSMEELALGWGLGGLHCRRLLQVILFDRQMAQYHTIAQGSWNTYASLHRDDAYDLVGFQGGISTA